MPTTAWIYANGLWRESKDLYVSVNNSWRVVTEGSIYANGAWRKIHPSSLPPAGIRVTASPSSILTQESSTITIQLIDVNGDSSGEARSISVSTNAGGAGSFSTAPTSTNAQGTASFTFNSNNNSGTASVTVTSSGLTNGSTSITVSLRTGLLPSLGSPVSQQWGFNFAHNNVDTANYSYSGSISAPNGNALLFIGTSYTDNPVSIFMTTVNSGAPVASQDASNVYCTSGNWGGGNGGGGVSVTISTSRNGYTSRSATVSGGVSLDGFTLNFSYQWKYYDGANFVNWGNPSSSGTRAKGTFYQQNIVGRSLFCEVTCSRSYSGSLTGANFVNSNKITGT